MSPNDKEDFTKKNMTLEEAIEYSEYVRGKMLTGDDLKYEWKKDGKVINGSWT